MAAKYWPLKRDFKVILCGMMNGFLHLSSRITEFIKSLQKSEKLTKYRISSLFLNLFNKFNNT